MGLTSETTAWRGRLDGVVRDAVYEIQRTYDVSYRDARAMLARALRSALVSDEIDQQCAFYARGDQLPGATN